MRISAGELERGTLDDATREQLVADFKLRGYLTLEGCLPPELIASLLKEYRLALDAKVARFDMKPADAPTELAGDTEFGRPRFRPIGGNHDLHRWNMHLPSRLPFLDPRLIANPIVMAVIDAVLGPDCVLNSLVSDTAFEGCQYQTVHQDSQVLRLTMNVPLVDFTAENGATEIWPGSHCRNAASASKSEAWRANMHLSDEECKELAGTIEPNIALIPAGTLFLRDQRMLHRGTPNKTSIPRPMLSLLYFHAARELPLRFASEGAARVALRTRELARFASKPDLLNRANAAGRIIEYMARSDRDYRRPIPRDVWDTLPPTAKRLLRFARVASDDRGERMRERTMRGSVKLLAATLRGLSAAIGGPDDR